MPFNDRKSFCAPGFHHLKMLIQSACHKVWDKSLSKGAMAYMINLKRHDPMVYTNHMFEKDLFKISLYVFLSSY